MGFYHPAVCSYIYIYIYIYIYESEIPIKVPTVGDLGSTGILILFKVMKLDEII